jgi:hypothetical protein
MLTPSPVERYIGLDVHSQSTAMVVVCESGKRVASQLLETSASSLINAIKTVPGTRRLILEEGTQSAWLSEVLRPHVQEVVVTSPKPAADRTKNDMQDAFVRAEEQRRNAVYKRIYKPGPRAMPVREALRLYTAFNNDVVRAKNRFKALLRGRGVTGLGRGRLRPGARASQTIDSARDDFQGGSPDGSQNAGASTGSSLQKAFEQGDEGTSRQTHARAQAGRDRSGSLETNSSNRPQREVVRFASAKALASRRRNKFEREDPAQSWYSTCPGRPYYQAIPSRSSKRSHGRKCPTKRMGLAF